MPKKIVYECAFCKKTFKTERGMKNCEDRCKAVRRDVAESAKIQKEKAEQFKGKLENLDSVEAIRQFIIENSDSVHDVQFEVRFSSNASNTHSCPKDGVSNFSKKRDLPLGYPAMVGKVTIYQYIDKKVGSITHELGYRYNIRTGSGGGGATTSGYYHTSYGVTIWLDDFPKLKERVDKVRGEVDDFETEMSELRRETEVVLTEAMKNNVSAIEAWEIEKQIEELRWKQDVLITKYETEKTEILKSAAEKVKDRRLELCDKAAEFGINKPSTFHIKKLSMWEVFNGER